MTWQNSYIQPGNEALLGHSDSIIPVIFGVNSSLAGFDYFDGMNENTAVCDIDACFTNHISLPSLPSEHMYIRILNVKKHYQSYSSLFRLSRTPRLVTKPGVIVSSRVVNLGCAFTIRHILTTSLKTKSTRLLTLLITFRMRQSKELRILWSK